MKKKLLTVLIIVLTMFVAIGVMNVSAEFYGDLTYTISNGKVTITDCEQSATSAEIPSEIDGYPVTSIGERAFYGCRNLTSITIPDSVTSIGERAFYGCYSLTSITIPDSVTSIGDWAFQYCDNLESITIPDSVTSIGDNAFSGCGSLESVTIGDSVTSIGDYAFSGCYSLTSITIPDSVTSIEEGAFSDCSSLTSINVGENNQYFSSLDGNLYNKDNTELIQYAIGKTDTSFIIPDSVKSIGYGAFSICGSLTSITIPDSVTSIGEYAFYYCGSLTTVNYKGTEASWNKISILSGNDCLVNTTINYIEEEEHYGDLTYTISNGEVTITGCGQSVKSAEIPSKIGEYPVTSIGYGAFYNCYSLTSITIPNSITSIGTYAFYYCESLKSITIPDSVTSIGEEAFSWCESLESITIPDSVTSIGDSAFSNCGSLTSITIPDSVTSIGEEAFSGCDSLTTVNYKGTEASWNKISISSGNDYLVNATRNYIAGTKTTVSADGKAFTVAPFNLATGKTVILALYENDTFVEMQSAIYIGEEIPFTTDKAYTDARVMAWNELTDLSPVTDVEFVNLGK